MSALAYKHGAVEIREGLQTGPHVARYCYPSNLVQFHLENDKRAPQYTLGPLEAGLLVFDDPFLT